MTVSLGGRAQLRISSEQERFQQNRETIAQLAIEEFQEVHSEETVTPNDPIEAEWVDAYWTLAEKVTSEDMQSLWARMLVNKTARGLAYSPRLLNFVSLMDKAEIEAIENIAPFVGSISDGEKSTFFIALSWSKMDGNVSDEAKAFVSANERLRAIVGDRADELLRPIGVYVESGWAHEIRIPRSTTTTMLFQGYRLKLSASETVSNVYLGRNDLSIGAGVQLSHFGFQLSRLCFKSVRTKSYLECSSEILRRCGLVVEIEEC